ncbi:MAG: SGNH/GDSL hydrolase family protein [Planctomycetes bacterium]|nr:SGNH/GDSL hydrolase family protein [Planctomycetota bacterium]
MPNRIEELDRNFASPEASEGLLWYDIRAWGLEGQGWTETEAPFDRLPARAKGLVRPPVWELSRHSAGLAVRFVTSSSKVGARWTLRSPNLAMDHMPATGVSGLDLYVRDRCRWHWLSIGRPKAQSNSAMLANLHPAPAGGREFLLYLPLYNGVDSVRIGLTPDAQVQRAPGWPGTAHQKPIVFYGTSIVQGGCASRPGTAYPAVVGRHLERPTINLGFSGNGPMDPEMAGLLGELDASVYVLDCVPNMGAALVRERTENFVRALRSARPSTPIVLLENIVYQATLSDTPEPAHEPKNAELRAAFARLLAAGTSGLHLVPGEYLLGHDGEATVDGTHPTDVGFLRMADRLVPVLRPL